MWLKTSEKFEILGKTEGMFHDKFRSASIEKIREELALVGVSDTSSGALFFLCFGFAQTQKTRVHYGLNCNRTNPPILG
jgi:hypothetical protein